MFYCLKMSAALFSAFYDISEFLSNENEKSLNNNYNNFNSMLDKKAVGSPVGFAPGYHRRHSTSNLQALANTSSITGRYPGGSFSHIKETGVISSGSNNTGGGINSGVGVNGGSHTAMLNKENKFRDRSYSDNQQLSSLQLIHQQQQQQQKQPCNGGGGGGGGQVNSTRYKTELCRPFEESGTCKYGDKCQFAHGMPELRSLTRHPKYKTELCRTFHTIGFCPYGPRCHFIHNAEERRQAPCGPGCGGNNNNNNNPSSPSSSSSSASALGNSFHHHHHHHHHHHPPQQQHMRPKLHHSQSFAGFPSVPSGMDSPLMESPTSRTPPPLSSSSSSSSSSSCCSSSSSSSAASSSSNSSSSMYSDELMLSPGVLGSSLNHHHHRHHQHHLQPQPVPACANNAFTFSSQELSNLLTPLAIQTQQLPSSSSSSSSSSSCYSSQQQQQQQQQQPPHPPPGCGGTCPPSSPTYTLSQMQSCLRRLAESPVFDASSSSPPDSLSDRESYLSSSGSLSGSESPSMDPARRLPIFSRLSISED